MNWLRTKLVALVVTILLGPSGIAFANSEGVSIEAAWARASVGTKRPGVAYMTIRNDGAEPVTLMAFRTDLAEAAMLHRTVTDANGVSSMTPVSELSIAPGEIATLAPGGLHVMLMQLQTALKEGESFSLTLVFSDGRRMAVEVPILNIAARGAAP